MAFHPSNRHSAASSTLPQDLIATALDQAAIVVVTNADGIITYCNERFQQISGYSEVELIGSTHQMLNSGVHSRDFFTRMYATISKGETWRGTICNRRKDGSLYWVDTTIVPRPGDDGAPHSYTAIRFDVTGHVETHKALREAKQRANEATLAKTQFLAVMSHEIRTPLNGVIAVADALAESGLPVRQREMADLILKSGQTLERIVSDILDMAKIEAGKLEIDSRSFDLRAEISAVAGVHALRAHDKLLQFDLQYSTAVDRRVIGDPVRIRQIVDNLLANAIKFTSTGGIVMKVALKEAGDGGTDVEIAVEDTGIGMKAETLDSLFQPFTQADPTIARKYGGTGLGLSISRKLAEQMGGTLTASSRLGHGSRFVLKLLLSTDLRPVLTPEPAAIGAYLASVAPRILVVDDHPTNQRVVEMLLSPFGAEVICASDGFTALQKVKSEAFDCILMDIQMPLMDGLAATACIRRYEAECGCPRTPIAMFTANAFADSNIAAMASGADGVITKPVTLPTLVAQVERLLGAS